VISTDLLPILWIGTAVSFFIFLVFFLGLRKDISYKASRVLPGSKASGRRPPEPKSMVIWGLFTIFALSTLAGTGLIVTTFQVAEGNENAFVPPPAPTPTPTPGPYQGPPLTIDITFPEGLDPCNVSALTLIPGEVNPYELPLVYPIEPWFERGQFLQTTFARLQLRSRAGEEIQVSDQVLASVRRHDSLPGPLNAAFTLCEDALPRSFPTIELSASTVEASIPAAEGPFVMRPGQNSYMEVKLFGISPGYYEVQLGVEFVENGVLKTAWAEDIVIVQVPERIHRWSSGVITYWGDCELDGSYYHCEEVVLEEPILEQPAVAAGSEDEVEPTPAAAVCPVAPPNRLEPGMEAVVSQRLGLRLRLREEPGLNSEIITSLPRGTRLDVSAGPVCKDGYYWFEVETNWGSRSGWMAEGEPNLYYLEPVR
jgi:hypothetical protein